MADTDLEWEERSLCPDGACIGVIGDDGNCKVCGRAGLAGGPFRREVRAEIADENDAELDAAPASDAGAQAGGEFDDERELCGDDACIGLIGPDGNCKECGKPRSATVTAAT